MRFILSLIVFFSVVTSSKVIGQEYYHSPNDTLIALANLGQQVTLNITQVHTSNDTLQFVWEKLNVSMPLEWDATICDNSNCYLSLIDAGTTLPVLPGDDGLLLIHCTPQSVMSLGIIQYTMYEINSPNEKDTLTWIINASGLSVEFNSKQNDYFSVWNKEVKWMGESFQHASMSIVSMNGSVVFETSDYSSETLDLQIENGNYWILLKTKERTYSQKIALYNEN